MDTDKDALTLTGLGTALARSWRVLAAGAVTGLLLGVGVQAALPPRFEAVAVVRVEPGGTEPTSGRLDMAAEESVARSRRVTTEALALLDDPTVTPREVERSLHVAGVEGSSVLHVRYSARSPGRSADGADAVAQAYLAVRSVDEMARIDRLTQRLSREIRLADAETRAGLRSERARLAVAEVGAGEVVDPARPPTSSTGPGPVVSALGGLVLGVLATAPLAAARLSRSPAAGAS